MKGKYLITCDNWFVAPDGHSYLAVWGDCETVTAESALGLVPNRNSANWFVKVSNNGGEMIVAGCQIHYAASCPERPNTDATEQNFDDRGKVVRDGKIYIPGEILGKPEPEKLAELMPKKANNCYFINEGDYKIWRPNCQTSAEFFSEFLNYEPQIFNRFLRNIDEIKFKEIFEAIKSDTLKGMIHEIHIKGDQSLTILFTNNPTFRTEITPF